MAKPKWETMRFRKRDPEHNLLAAATHYIRARGGRALVIGGISCESLGGFRYVLGVRFTGRCPQKGKP